MFTSSVSWLKMAYESLSDYEDFSYWPHFLVYEIYVFLKYVAIVVVFNLSFIPKLKNHFTVVHLLLVSISLAASCFFCFICCFQHDKFWNFFHRFNNNIFSCSAKFSHFLVKTLFGPKEGVVNRFGDYKEDREDGESGLPKLYVRKKELTHNEVSHLALLFFAFCLLAGITAFDVYFLEETYVCSDDPSIYCYPLAIDTNADNFDLNLTQAQEHPITDCSFWNSENVSSRVTFRCFRWIYNSKAVVASVGGLITLFLLTVKVTALISIAFAKMIIKKVTCERNLKCCSREYVMNAQKCLKVIRITFLGFAAVVESVYASFLISKEVNINHSNKFYELFDDHSNQILLSVGIFTTMMLLPVEEYASASIEGDYSKIPDGCGNTNGSNESERRYLLNLPEQA